MVFEKLRSPRVVEGTQTAIAYGIPWVKAFKLEETDDDLSHDFPIQANTLIYKVLYAHTINWDDTGTVTLAIGDSGSSSRFVGAFGIKTAASVDPTESSTQRFYDSDDTITVAVTAQNGDGDAGVVYAWVMGMTYYESDLGGS